MIQSNQYSIWPCINSDRNCLINIWESSVRATHLFLTEDEILFYRERILSCYFDIVELYKIVIGVKSNSKAVGFIGVSGVKLEMLFIDPAYFRQRLGSYILDFAIKMLMVRDVDVNEENESAKFFYIANGFTPVSRSDKDGEGKNHPIISMRYK